MNAVQHWFDALEATWPAAGTQDLPGWRIREGQGGGKRVSAASATAPGSDPAVAEAAMRALGQTPLFMVRPGEDALDAALAARGYACVDPTVIRAAPIETLTDKPLPRVSVFCLWEPLQLQRDIWAEGGIGPERIAVMERAPQPKTSLMARWNDHPGGAGFAAVAGKVAMVHALEVLPHQRNEGLGKWMMRAAALWAAPLGAEQMAIAVTEENTAANALYASLGMAPVTRYHYRVKEEDTQ